MSGDHSVSAARNSSTQFSTGGGDERVAFKFGAGHAHWLTVTRHVTDLQLRERRPDRDRPIINTAGPRSAGRSTVRVSLERAPGLPPVCRQSTPSRERDRVTRNVTASILIGWAGGCSVAEAERPGNRDGTLRRRVNALPQQHAPTLTSRPTQLSRVSKYGEMGGEKCLDRTTL